MVLLSLHGLDLGLAFGFDAGPLDLGLAEGVEARGLFASALLFGAAALLFGLEASLFLFAGAALGVFAGAGFGIGASFLVFLLLLDAILLEAEQLLEGEEDRTLFLLVGHVRLLPGSKAWVGDGLYFSAALASLTIYVQGCQPNG
ncbi:MAG TPA: hypothetical protein PLI95_06095 [Polyangiaceae bacterium]|nr:hypothetical protein [Polyangiaceae bacterium]